MSPLPPPFLELLLQHEVVRHEITLWSAWLSCPGCGLCQLLVNLQPTRWWRRVGKREKVNVVQVLLSNSKSSGVLSALFYSQILNSALYGLLWRKLTASQPGPTQGVSQEVQQVGKYL